MYPKSMDLSFFLNDENNLYKISKDKGLAKLGDNLVNLIYSIAKSITLNKITGKKVPGKVLANALRESTLRKYAGKHNDSHGLADSVEALVAFCWIKKLISIEELYIIIAEAMKDNLEYRTEEKIATAAFSYLLRKIAEIFSKIYNNKES